VDRKEIRVTVISIIKLSLALLILAHLSGPPLAYAPVQEEYRVEDASATG